MTFLQKLFGVKPPSHAAPEAPKKDRSQKTDSTVKAAALASVTPEGHGVCVWNHLTRDWEPFAAIAIRDGEVPSFWYRAGVKAEMAHKSGRSAIEMRADTSRIVDILIGRGVIVPKAGFEAVVREELYQAILPTQRACEEMVLIEDIDDTSRRVEMLVMKVSDGIFDFVRENREQLLGVNVLNVKRQLKHLPIEYGKFLTNLAEARLCTRESTPR